MSTSRRDHVGILAACVLLVAGLAVAKLAGWITPSWWVVVVAPFMALALEAIFFLPPLVVGTIQYHLRD